MLNHAISTITLYMHARDGVILKHCSYLQGSYIYLSGIPISVYSTIKTTWQRSLLVTPPVTLFGIKLNFGESYHRHLQPVTYK